MGHLSGSLHSWSVLGVLFAVAIAAPMGCEDPREEVRDSPALSMLRSVGPSVVQPTLQRMVVALDDLDVAVRAWGADPESNDVRDDARAAFLSAMDVWQELEVMQIGPAGPSLNTTAGRDLREEVYSWPTVNPCRVDQETVRGAFDAPVFFQENLVNTYGLDAVEHLLYASLDNACPNQVDINADGTWDVVGPEGIAQLRADYASVLVAQTGDVVAELIEHWAQSGGDFGTLLSTPGASDSPYGSANEATNAVFDALFYLETVTKDRKLAEPLGFGDCIDECNELLEGGHSRSSTAWVAANLRGFQGLFTGGEGIGFEDLLRELGHSDLADRMTRNVEDALALAEVHRDPLDEMAINDPARAEALFEAVKKVTDDLKGDLATVMTLRIPSEAAGDND